MGGEAGRDARKLGPLAEASEAGRGPADDRGAGEEALAVELSDLQERINRLLAEKGDIKEEAESARTTAARFNRSPS